MSSIPQVILSSTSFGQAQGPYNGSTITFSSSKVRGNGYYGYTDGLHTVSYKLTNFIGVVGFQATLAAEPTEADWFNIPNTNQGTTTVATTGSFYYNFSGNFVWCRCTVTSFTGGIINKVLYNT